MPAHIRDVFRATEGMVLAEIAALADLILDPEDSATTAFLPVSQVSPKTPEASDQWSPSNAKQAKQKSTNFCWYHRRWGSKFIKPRNATLPARDLREMLTRVTSDAGTKSRLLFTTDRATNTRYLIDTGAAVSVVPAQLHDWKSGEKGSSLRAANGTHIATYGTKMLSVWIGNSSGKPSLLMSPDLF